MKNLTRKLMVSIITAVFALVTLGTTTFAWFTTSNVASTGSFDGTVQGGEGFEIAVLNSGVELGINQVWYTGEVPSTAITDLYKDTFKGFRPLTYTAESISSINGLGSDTVTYSKLSDGVNYITFDLWFRTVKENTGKIQSVNKRSGEETSTTMTSAIVSPWYSDQTFQLASSGNIELIAGHQYEFNVDSAARIMISGKTNNLEKTIIYENKAVAGIAMADGNSGNAGNSIGFSTELLGAHVYYLAKVTNSKLTIPGEEHYGVGLTTDKLGDEAAAPATNIVDLAAPTDVTGVATDAVTAYNKYNLGKVTVTVWVEGWDGECMNAIFLQKLSVVLGFKMVA